MQNMLQPVCPQHSESAAQCRSQEVHPSEGCSSLPSFARPGVSKAYAAQPPFIGAPCSCATHVCRIWNTSRRCVGWSSRLPACASVLQVSFSGHLDQWLAERAYLQQLSSMSQVRSDQMHRKACTRLTRSPSWADLGPGALARKEVHPSLAANKAKWIEYIASVCHCLDTSSNHGMMCLLTRG